MKFYCLKCKDYVDIPDKDVKYVKANNRMRAVSTCPKCKSGLSKYVKPQADIYDA